MNERKIAVIGGGAAGMMAAGTAAEYGANQVFLPPAALIRRMKSSK